MLLNAQEKDAHDTHTPTHLTHRSALFEKALLALLSLCVNTANTRIFPSLDLAKVMACATAASRSSSSCCSSTHSFTSCKTRNFSTLLLTTVVALLVVVPSFHTSTGGVVVVVEAQLCAGVTPLPSDIVFALDGSATAVSSSQFAAEQSVVTAFTKVLSLDSSSGSIALTVFGETACPSSSSTGCTPLQPFTPSLSGLTPVGGNTNTGAALSYIFNNLIVSSFGRRQAVIIVQTGAVADSSAAQQALADISGFGASTFVITTLNTQSMSALASPPTNFYPVKTFADFTNNTALVRSIAQAIQCPGEFERVDGAFLIFFFGNEKDVLIFGNEKDVCM